MLRNPRCLPSKQFVDLSLGSNARTDHQQVLGDNISSPPRTPSPNSGPSQLAPREPSYITSTFKPPALYPSKKQRTESTATSASSYGAVSNAAPRFPSSTAEPRTNGHNVGGNVQFPPMETIDTRRANGHILSGPSTATSPPWSAQYSTLKGLDGRPRHENHYQTPEQTPTSAMSDSSFPRPNPFTGSVQDPFTREMRDSFSQPNDRPMSRRSSTSAYGVYPPRPYERDQSRRSPYQTASRYPLPVRDGYTDPRDNTRYTRTEQPQQPCAMNAFTQQNYQSNVPAFFMPSHYEYQHGKARKRSNLPKQSTEIMKTWFDQVCV
jgi:hypothetical protein